MIYEILLGLILLLLLVILFLLWLAKRINMLEQRSIYDNEAWNHDKCYRIFEWIYKRINYIF